MSETHTPKILAGEVALLARRYAHALLDLAEEKKQIEAVEADLKALEAAIEGNQDFAILAHYPRLTKKQVLETVKAVCESSGFGELTTAFLMQVARNHRLPILGTILEAFTSVLAEKRGEYTAYVKAPRALTAEQESALAAQLSKMTDGSVKVVVDEDPSLLGGLTIKLGSRLIDASVKGKLAQIERQLKSQQEAA